MIMSCLKYKKIILFLLVFLLIGKVSAQAVVKIGDNPYTIGKSAVLDIESTIKGFLPPRMSKSQRDAIVSPETGLQVWCSDCNTSTEPASGELDVYLGNGWAPFTILPLARLTTGKKTDTNKPVLASPTSVIINGVLMSISGIVPTETGIVWREIVGNDFATLPILDGNGVATVPTYKTAGTLVTSDGAAISVTIPDLTSTRPYYFRAYAKNPFGIGYGNPVIFNCAPPVISTPVVTGGSTSSPTFAGILTVNAGTPKGTIIEYGYCSATTANPTTSQNKVVLSVGKIEALDAILNSETFTVDPTVDLGVNNYNVLAFGSTTYFRYYVIANGITIYSNQAIFTPSL
jgi:hypothetical protein